MPEQQHFFNFRADWLKVPRSSTWRLTLEHDKYDGVAVTTHIDVMPNQPLIEHCRQREAEGLPGLLDGFMAVAAQAAADRVRYQILTEDLPAVSRVFLDLKDGLAVRVVMTSTREADDPNVDTVAYLKAVSQVVAELGRRNAGELSEEQRARMSALAEGRFRVLQAEHNLVRDRPLRRVELSDRDSIGLYIDESGEPGVGKAGASTYFVVGAVAIRDSEREEVRRKLNCVVASAPKGVNELKFLKVDTYSERTRDKIYSDVLDIVNEHVERALVIAVSKEGFIAEKMRSAMAEYYFGYSERPDFDAITSTENFSEYSRALYDSWASRFIAVPFALFLMEKGSTGHVCYDKVYKETRNRVLLESFEEANRFLPSSFAAEGIQWNYTIPLELAHSSHEPLLWLGELFAREVSKVLQGEPSRIGYIVDKLPQVRGVPGRHVALVSPHGTYCFFDVLSGEVHLELPD